MPKYLTNSKYYDDGAGFHAETGRVDCLSLYINGVNSGNLFDASYTYIENQISALQNTLTVCSYDSATQTFVIGNNLKCLGTFTLYIGGTPYNVNTFITNTNNSINTNTNNITTNTNNIITNTADIQTIKTTLTGVSYNNSYNAFQIGGTTDCRILNALYLYSSGTPYSVNVFVVNTNTSISTLVNKTQDISYSSGLTTIEKLSFNTFINGTSKANFENIMNTCFDLSGNCQGQINGAYAAAGAAAAAAAAAYTGANLFTTDAIATYATAQALVDAGQDTAIDTLDGKLASYTYNLADNIVSIASRVNCNSFGAITFNGSLNQNNVNAQNDLYGNTYYHNHLRSANGAAIFAQDVDLTGNLTVSGTSTITGASTLNGNLTCSGASSSINSTAIQLGSNSTAILSTYATSNFYGPTTIRNNSTTSNGTISPYLNVLSIATNTNARKLQGITIGVEQILNNQSNCNIGYNYVSDGSTTNYGYVGLNTNTLNTIESIRWSPTKVSINTGNFEVANNASIIGSLTCNTINNSGAANSAPLAITTTGANNNIVITSVANTNLFGVAVKLNSNDVQIGSNQGAGVNNTVLIGSTTSNTTTNIPNGLKTNTIAGYNTANPINVNNPSINIGTNQGIAAANTINIGSYTSGSIIGLNGIILVNGYMTGITTISMSGAIGQF